MNAPVNFDKEAFVPTPKRFVATAKKFSSHVAYRVLDGDKWVTTSWKDYLDEVETAARSLIKLGIKKGDIVCILGINRPEWTIMAFAAMMVGGAPAGIYFTSSAEEISYILNHAESAILLVETDEQFAKIKKIEGDLTHLKHVIMMRGATIDDPLQTAWSDFNALGDADLQSELDTRLEAVEPSDTGTLIYTSGTTGPPKAVVLSFGSLAWTAWTIDSMFDTHDDHRLLSYLPLAHIAEALNCIHSHAFSGCEVWFARSINELGDHLKDCKPTIFFGVPRVWEKMYETLTQRLGEATGVKAKLAAWSLKVGAEVAEVKFDGKQPSGMLAIKYRLADKLVLSKIRAALGLDECLLPVSGAAPISKNTLLFFASLGIFIYEVYGQSEDCGPTSFNVPGGIKLGTVGRPIPGMEVKIAEDDEILVRAPSLFDGYAKDPNATKAVLKDGWMLTGDLGRIDNEGFLSIIGRKKDILITAGGKNITPANLEGALMEIPLVEHAVVCGEGQKYLTALLTLNPDFLAAFAKDHGLGDDARSNKKVHGEIQKCLDVMNNRFARVEQIRKFAVLDRSLTMEDNELTPTLKVKRSNVTKNHADVVAALYAD